MNLKFNAVQSVVNDDVVDFDGDRGIDLANRIDDLNVGGEVHFGSLVVLDVGIAEVFAVGGHRVFIKKASGCNEQGVNFGRGAYWRDHHLDVGVLTQVHCYISLSSVSSWLRTFFHHSLLMYFYCSRFLFIRAFIF